MNLRQQVTNLELSQKLKKLKVKQSSLFHWTYATAWSKSIDGGKTPGRGKAYVESGNPNSKDSASAFTVGELGEIIGNAIDAMVGNPPDKTSIAYRIEIGRWPTQGWRYVINNPDGHAWTSTNEADTRAMMLIYLIQNKLITL